MKFSFNVKRASFKLLLTAILTTILLYESVGFVIAGTPQPRKSMQTTSSQKNYESISKPIDSAIAEIAKEVERITSSPYITKTDSLHLKELGSRMIFFATLSKNLKDDNYEPENNIQQDRLSISVLVFGFSLIILILLYQFRQKKEINNITFKLIGLLFIGTISVFLIPAGFDNNQITPVIGLLGTLAGYLIGTSKDGHETNKIDK